MAEISWRYIAGFTDADGSVVISKEKGRRNPRVVLKWMQTEEDSWVLYEMKYFFSVHGVESAIYDRQGYGTNSKPQCYLQIGKRECVEFILHKLMPYLIVKESIAKEGLRIISETRRREKELFKRCSHGRTLRRCKSCQPSLVEINERRSGL